MAFSCSNLERSFGFQRSDCMPLSFFYGKSPFWSPFPLLNKLIISYVRTYSQLACSMEGALEARLTCPFRLGPADQDEQARLAWTSSVAGQLAWPVPPREKMTDTHRQQHC